MYTELRNTYFIRLLQDLTNNSCKGSDIGDDLLILRKNNSVHDTPPSGISIYIFLGICQILSLLMFCLVLLSVQDKFPGAELLYII